ncbi:50S ribosomal protein L4 [Candidatus Sarmatiella mevalonica]|uniref:50S ribosomal protein L4 n=1 Tax=Candidatus Sarmatiella mevalonica TaxID=2770581 RepID=UPI001922AE64|nr:50S ribosomal protein L4 [Candidatus Sarmatiella mevalonica]
MMVDLVNIANEKLGAVSVSHAIFGLEPRMDIIKLVIDWQMAKARSGCHATKTISEVSGTTKKPFKQKGTGNARQGSLRSVQMRGGGVSHGPVVRSHAICLNKKVRKLGLRHALSAKFLDGSLRILDDCATYQHKTAALAKMISAFGARKILILDDNDADARLRLASRNLFNVNVLPIDGANVLDIVRHDLLLLSRTALYGLQNGRLL